MLRVDLIGPKQNQNTPVISGSSQSTWSVVVSDRLVESNIDPLVADLIKAIATLGPDARQALLSLARLLLHTRSDVKDGQ